LDLAVGIFRAGVHLFSCFDAPPGTKMRAGLFTAEYLLPRYIFRPGRYIMSFGAQRSDGGSWLWSPDVLSFDVAEDWDAVVRARDAGVGLVPYEGRRFQNGSRDYPAICGGISSGGA